MASTYALPVEGQTRNFAYSPAHSHSHSHSHSHHGHGHGRARSFNPPSASLLTPGSNGFSPSSISQQRQKWDHSPILEEGSSHTVRKATSETNLGGGHAHHYSEGALSPNHSAFEPPLTAGPGTLTFSNSHSIMGRSRARGDSDLGRPAVKSASAPAIPVVPEHDHST